MVNSFFGIHTCASDANSIYDTVDVFDSKTNLWTTAQLSEARYGLASASLPLQGLALFAGGIGIFE
jgi:hypothetical protein